MSDKDVHEQDTKPSKRHSLAGGASSSDTVAVLQKGQLLSGRYRIVEKIGAGGMGVVYRVEDTKWDGRVFALKALPPDMAKSSAAIKRLKREADSAIDLRHANIMALHSFDNDGPHHFLVMELLDGPDLEDALADKERFSLDEVLDVARQVCPALDHAHERGVVHRDIKPGNLLYKNEGDKQVVKIADFGIAYQVRDSIARITGQDTTGGTMHYMPPEQLAGEETDARSDQYALAATLYELLRGRTPFQGAGGVLINQIEKKQAAPIADVPDHVNAALLKGLAKKPGDRFASCGELLEALEGRLTVVDGANADGGGEGKLPVAGGNHSAKIIWGVGLLSLALILGADYSFGFLGLFKHRVISPAPTKAAAVTGQAKRAEQTVQTVTVKPTVRANPITVLSTPKAQVKPTDSKIEIVFGSKPVGAKVFCYETMPPFIGKTTEPFSRAFKPGKYRFKFAHVPGYDEKVVPFEVRHDGEKRLYVQLKKLIGYICVECTPADANITVRGRSYNGGKMALSPGKYEIIASKSGYKSRSHTVTVSDGKIWTVRFTLEPTHKIGEEKTVEGIRFCWCPPGEFMMGSPASDTERDSSEEPQHKVKISKGFWLSKYEISQSEWLSLMDSNPSNHKVSDNPVDGVTWRDCQSFVRELNRKNGSRYKFRLPTEAEWEYACRAGTKTPYHFSKKSCFVEINYIDNNPNWHSIHSVVKPRAAKVGSYLPNAWGLHEMHGNVEEWCSDWYSKEYYRISAKVDPTGPDSGSERVVRGGSWADSLSRCRSASRKGVPPDKVDCGVGFRLLLE